MNCPNCKKEIKTAEDLTDLSAEQSSEYIEVKAKCECGHRFYTSFSVEDFTSDE